MSEFLVSAICPLPCLNLVLNGGAVRREQKPTHGYWRHGWGKVWTCPAHSTMLPRYLLSYTSLVKTRSMFLASRLIAGLAFINISASFPQTLH